MLDRRFAMQMLLNVYCDCSKYAHEQRATMQSTSLQ